MIQMIHQYISGEDTPIYIPVFFPLAFVMVVTVLVPDLVSALVLVAFLYPFYFITKGLQPRLFSCDRTTSHLKVVLPLYLLLTVWGVLLFMSRRLDILIGYLGPFTVVLLTALWPVFRKDLERKERRIPYQYSYSIASTFFLVATLSRIWMMS
jgi:hypothetical protein